MPSKTEVVLTPEEQIQFTNYYKLTEKDKETIRDMKKRLGMTVDEISRKYQVTPPDINRIITPPKNYGSWTAEEKMKHWIAGQRRAATVKRQREEKKNNLLKK